MSPAQDRTDRVAPGELDSLADLFDAAVALPPAERERFVAGVADSVLRQRVERLLDGDAVWSAQEPRWRDQLGRIAGNLDATLPATIGSCRVIRRIGVGGMGDVFEAEEDGAVRRRVAVKIIRTGLRGVEAVQRFQNEVQALARMEHPGIVRVFRAGVHEDLPYFIMEYVDGRSLAEYLEHEPAPLRERLRLFVQVCRAVQHAHQKGILHRDLKPSNILVERIDGADTPRLIDFGLAKAVEGSIGDHAVITEMGHVPGTAHFISPEQLIRGAQRVDTRTDVYALGAILFWLLTGRYPFGGPTEEVSRDEVLRRIREEDPPRPSAVVSEFGPAPGLRQGDHGSAYVHVLDWVVLRALERDVDRRYASASELATDVERFLADQPVSASRPGVTYRVRRAVRRHRVAMVLGGSVLVILLVGASGLALALRERLRADQRTRVLLYESLLAGARVASGPLAVGQRARLLRDMGQAAALHASLDRPASELPALRSAAALALAQPDLQVLREWDGFPDGARGLDINNAMTRYARGDETGNVIIRDVATDTEELRLPGFGRSVWTIEFGPDDEHLLVVYTELHVPNAPRELRLWHLPSGTAKLAVAGAAVMGAFSRDSRRVVSSLADGSIMVYRVEDGSVERRVRPPGPVTVQARFAGATEHLLTWEPGGTWVALGSERFELTWPVREVTADSAARRLAVGGDNQILLIDVHAGVRGGVLQPVSRQARMEFRPAHNELLTNGWDSMVRVWDASAWRELIRVPGNLVRLDRTGGRFLYRLGTRLILVGWKDSDIVRSVPPATSGTRPHVVAGNPGGNLVVAVGGGRVRAWDVETGREVEPPDVPATTAAFSWDGSKLLLGEQGRVTTWRVQRDDDHWRLSAAGSMPLGSSRIPLWLATDSTASSIAVLDGPTGRVEVLDSRDAAGFKATISSHLNTMWTELTRDGRFVVTAPWNAPGVTVWSVQSADTVVMLPGTELATRGLIDASRDGEWLATYTDRPQQICVWKTADWSRVGCRTFHHPASRPGRLAFSPDGTMLVATDPTQGRLRVLEVNALNELATIELASAEEIAGIQFVGDGRYLSVVDARGVLHTIDMHRLRNNLENMGLALDARGRPAPSR